MIRRILQKIEWKLHRVNLKFNLITLYLHDNDGCIGITICGFIKDFTPYSLFAFEFRLPNGAERKIFQVTDWDLLYISTPMYKWYDRMDGNILWAGYKPSKFETFKYNVCKRLYN